MIPGVLEQVVVAAARPATGASIRTKAAAGKRAAAAAAATTNIQAIVAVKALVTLATAVVVARHQPPQPFTLDPSPFFDEITTRYD